MRHMQLQLHWKKVWGRVWGRVLVRWFVWGLGVVVNNGVGTAVSGAAATVGAPTANAARTQPHQTHHMR